MPEGLLGLLIVIPLGLCLGSFATAMIARIPAGKSWIASSSKLERSACPHCGHTLSVLDLIPLLSWLCLRGKCRYCRHKIGSRYPAIELVTLLFCLAAYTSWGLSAFGIILIFAVPFIIAMIVIDIEHMILPDQLQIILYGMGLVAIVAEWYASAGRSGFLETLGMALASSFIFFLLAWLLAKGGKFFLKREALGMGDVKFFAVAGLWLGIINLPAFLILAGAGGVIMGLYWKFILKKQLFPFGPALISACFLLLLSYGPALSGILGAFQKGLPGLS